MLQLNPIQPNLGCLHPSTTLYSLFLSDIPIQASAGPPGPLSSECRVRKFFLPELSSFLRSSSYKSAIFLVNIPDIIYQEEKVECFMFIIPPLWFTYKQAEC